MLKRITSAFGALLLSTSSLFVFAPMIVHASAVDTCTFKNTAIVNGAANLGDAANWNCTIDGNGLEVPSTGDTLVFDYGTSTGLAAATTLTNTLSDNSVYAAINFIGAPTSNISNGFTITGTNKIHLTGGISGETTIPYTRINIGLVADSDLTFAATNIGFQGADKTIALGTHKLTTNGYQGNTSFSGSGIIENSSTFNAYGSNNTHTGTIKNTGSGYVLFSKDSIGEFKYEAVGSDSSLNLTIDDDATIGNQITLNGDGRSGTGYNGSYIIPTLIISSSTADYSGGKTVYRTAPRKITLSNVNLTSDVNYDSYMAAFDTVEIKGATLNGKTISRIDGSQGKLTVNGSNIASNYKITEQKEAFADEKYWEVTDKQRYVVTAAFPKTVVTVISGGNLRVDKGGKVGDVTIISGGTLDGTDGTTGKLTVEADGIVAPGHSPGCLNTADFTTSGIYQVEIGGKDACTGYDQLKVTGAVNVTNSSISASIVNKFKPVAGQKYTIINNDGTDKVTGTFKDLAEGGTFKTPSGTVLKVSYVGGDGNDVVLKVVSVGTPDTGFGIFLNSPFTILAAATLSAGAILFTSRRLAPAKSKSRR